MKMFCLHDQFNWLGGLKRRQNVLVGFLSTDEASQSLASNVFINLP